MRSPYFENSIALAQVPSTCDDHAALHNSLNLVTGHQNYQSSELCTLAFLATDYVCTSNSGAPTKTLLQKYQ